MSTAKTSGDSSSTAGEKKGGTSPLALPATNPFDCEPFQFDLTPSGRARSNSGVSAVSFDSSSTGSWLRSLPFNTPERDFYINRDEDNEDDRRAASALLRRAVQRIAVRARATADALGAASEAFASSLAVNDRAFLRALKDVTNKEQRQVLRRLRRNTLSKKLFLADFNARTTGLKRALVSLTAAAAKRPCVRCSAKLSEAEDV